MRVEVQLTAKARNWINPQPFRIFTDKQGNLYTHIWGTKGTKFLVILPKKTSIRAYEPSTLDVSDLKVISKKKNMANPYLFSAYERSYGPLKEE